MNKFDELVDRHGTASTKWERYVAGSGEASVASANSYEDIIPMWVADTDFKTCSAITEALKERVKQGVFGYTLQPMPEFSDAVVAHLQTCYDWSIKKEWIVLLPSLVTGLNLACQVTRKLDSEERNDKYSKATHQIIIPSVIYPPFKSSPTNAAQEVVTVPLILTGQRWIIDIEALQEIITKHTRMILLCNPQNPGGSVYTQQELARIHQFCEQHDLLICSDEIHCDLVLEEDTYHIPIAKINKDAERHERLP